MMLLIILFVTSVADAAGKSTCASTTHGSVGHGGQGGNLLWVISSQMRGGFGDGGSCVRQHISKPSRMREYSQADSSQPQPAGIANTGLAKHSLYLIAMYTLWPATSPGTDGSHGSAAVVERQPARSSV